MSNDEVDEIESLMVSDSSQNRSRKKNGVRRKTRSISSYVKSRPVPVAMAIMVLAATISIYIYHVGKSSARHKTYEKDSDPTNLKDSDPTNLKDSDPTNLTDSDPTNLTDSDPTNLTDSDPTKLRLYSCPVNSGSKAKKYKADTFDKYKEDNEGRMRNNMTNFKKGSYDGLDANYVGWKRKFSEYVNSGDWIYESACGEGLNLFVTVEVLHKEGIDNITVFGNDYLQESVDSASVILETGTPGLVKQGVLCQGDSSDLNFVPSNFFDLAYTGYIEPIQDPLDLFNDGKRNLSKHKNMGKHKHKQNKNTRVHTDLELCKSDVWSDQQLVKIAQSVQEEWFSMWVSELIRIVKPGKVVILEQVALPICVDDYDWGGVTKEWWSEAVSKYGWDVDVESIEITDSTITGDRYNVVMKTNL